MQCAKCVWWEVDRTCAINQLKNQWGSCDMKGPDVLCFCSEFSERTTDTKEQNGNEETLGEQMDEKLKQKLCKLILKGIETCKERKGACNIKTLSGSISHDICPCWSFGDDGNEVCYWTLSPKDWKIEEIRDMWV